MMAQIRGRGYVICSKLPQSKSALISTKDPMSNALIFSGRVASRLVLAAPLEAVALIRTVIATLLAIQKCSKLCVFALSATCLGMFNVYPW